jgi:hypothetical protein
MTKIAGSGSEIRIHWSEAWIRGSGSVPKWHGSTSLYKKKQKKQYLYVSAALCLGLLVIAEVGHVDLREGDIRVGQLTSQLLRLRLPFGTLNECHVAFFYINFPTLRISVGISRLKAIRRIRIRNSSQDPGFQKRKTANCEKKAKLTK